MGALRVLIVIAKDDDVSPVLATFSQAGLDPTWMRIETREELVEALRNETWSLVVYDRTMRELAFETALLSADSISLVERTSLARTLMIPAD